MKRQTLAIAALAAIVSAALGGWFATRDATRLDADFPVVRDVRVELHRGEAVRHVKLHPDGVTPKHAIADNDDGTITNYWYRENGTLEKAITESAADETGARKQLRYAEVAADGATYVYDVEYFENGVKKKESKLVDPDNISRVYFFEDGSVRRSQAIVMVKLTYPVRQFWELSSEDVYYQGGMVAQTLRPLANRGWERKIFSPEGQLTVAKSMAPYGIRYVEQRFDDNGNLAMLIEQPSSGTKVTTWRPDGTLSEIREWHGALTGDTSLYIDVHDEKGRLAYRQFWALYEKSPARLWQIVEFNDQAKMVRSLYFVKDTKDVSENVYLVPGAGQKSVKSTFRDGILVSRETPGPDGKAVKEEFTKEDNIRLVLDTSRTILRAAELPPYVVEYVPEREH